MWVENVYDGSCPSGQFDYNRRVQLRGSPDPDWSVGGWSGTDDDMSLSTINFVTMPDTDHLVTVNYVEQATGPLLSISGSCPGPIQVDVTGAEPLQSVAFVFGTIEGGGRVPVGPCTGTLLGLQDPNLLARFGADAAGEISVSLESQGPVCGKLVQSLDETNCSVSNVDALP